LRVQQQLPRALPPVGPALLGLLARRPGRAHRAAEPSVVPGDPVPPGVHLHPARRPSAVHRLHSRGTRAARVAPAPGGRRLKAPRARSAPLPSAGILGSMQLTGHQVGNGRPLFLIAGPCVIEGASLTQEIAGRLKEITGRLGVPFIFKASYDKANRSSRASFRGLGIETGLKVVADVRRAVGVPVLTDVHEDTPLWEVAAVVDATHSVQLPGGQGASSGGQREFVPVLARAAVAAGVAGLFMETHPEPDKAHSDGPNAWPLARMEPLLATLCELDRAVKKTPYEES